MWFPVVWLNGRVGSSDLRNLQPWAAQHEHAHALGIDKGGEAAGEVNGA